MRRNFFTIVIAIILLYNMLSACSSQRKDQDNKLSLEYQATYTELSSVYDSLLSNTPEIRLIKNKAELNQDFWWEQTINSLHLDNSESESSAANFVENKLVSRYQDDWFQTHVLVEILFRCGSSTPRHEVKSIKKEGSSIVIQISRYLIGSGNYDELPQDEMETNWNILVELEKVDLTDGTKLQVELIKEVHKK